MSLPFQPTPASLPPKNAVLALRQPKGIPVHFQPLNPLQFILRAAEIYPDKPALVHPDVKEPVSYSFAVWCQRIQNLAYALIQAGIKPGDRVAVIAPNSYAVLCLINTRLKPSEVAYILDHSGSSLILVDYEYVHLLPPNLKVPVVVSRDTGRLGDPYEQFLSKGRAYSQERGWPGLEYEADEAAPALLCYTSGTTGRPKGVVTTLRGSYLAAVANAYESRIHRESTYLWFVETRSLNTFSFLLPPRILPMFHAGGWTFPWITLRTVDYRLIWKHFLNSAVTHYCGAPTVQIGIVNDPAAKPLPRSISAIIAGAAPTASLISSLEAIGIQPIHVYGLTEYGPFTRNYTQPSWAALPLKERSVYMARQGHSFSTAQNVRVVYQPKTEHDTELVDVPRDGKTVGEIYFRDPEATAKAFRGGSFNTGDLAVMHPDGAVAVVDRSKDIIISGGENASSLAIEQELASHPDVLEVSVVARSHIKWGERPHAFVILKSKSATKWKGRHNAFGEELKAYAKPRLPGFACPEWVDVVPELPKTSTGKILKTDLRKIVAKL
ncbi:hypothetical protein C8R46DRAFT_1264981 [Mycena filopes]|nr:hypothetical protein C8R46DRAFT_1264981 [Mycena filopes]